MANGDDDLRNIGISPRERLAHIERSLDKISEKLDVRFDAVEHRLSAVETAQAGQTSTAEFSAKAADLADAATKKAADLADAATKKAADLADTATDKAAELAQAQKALAQDVANFQLRMESFHDVHVAFDARQNAFDRKVSWGAGLFAAAVFASGLIGYFVG